MNVANAIPNVLLPLVGSVVGASRGGASVAATTGLSREGWRELARAFPALGPDPAGRAARARARMEFLVGRALATSRHGPTWRGSPPEEAPTLYATAHIGDLRALRYFLRRRVAVGTILAPENEERLSEEMQDRLFDEAFPQAFPHVFPSREPHRLLSALREGSLIAAADAAAEESFEAGALGGTIALDPRPFRLGRLAGVSCRPVFLTAPGGRLTVTVGDPLPQEISEALRRFAQVFAEVAAESPWDWDGATQWRRIAVRG